MSDGHDAELSVFPPESRRAGDTNGGSLAASSSRTGAHDARDPSRAERWLGWWRRPLGSPRAIPVALVVTLALSAPMFFLHYDSDDYFQLASLASRGTIDGVARAPWDLYAFAKDRATNVALREEGVWPWFADLDVLLAFFRPLASLSRALDEALWPGNIPLAQLHSLAWFALLLGLAGSLYRKLVATPWIAGLAFVLFASDEARSTTVAWLCNRNALISLAFGFAALRAHHLARAEGARVQAVLAPLFLALGLLGGETALQMGGYLFSYALFLDRGTLRSRVLSLAPYALVVACWAVAYKLLGYGAQGSGFYLDPVRTPLAFAAVVPERLVTYALALFGGVSTDWLDLLPLLGHDPRPLFLPAALVCSVLLVVAFGPLYRRDATVRFWVVGALLCALPACGVRPSDRMLTGSALGGMAVLATFLGALLDRVYPGRVRAWTVAFAAALAFVNLVYAPIARPFLISLNDSFDALLARADASLPQEPALAAQTLVLLNPPWDTFGIFVRLYREGHGRVQPKHYRWLATGTSSLRVERVDEHTLKLAPGAGYLATSSQQVLRSLERPLQVGEQVALEGVTLEVLSLTDDGRPREVSVRFATPLDDPSLRLFQWGAHEYVPFVPPAVGASVTLPAVDIARVLAGEG